MFTTVPWIPNQDDRRDSRILYSRRYKIRQRSLEDKHLSHSLLFTQKHSDMNGIWIEPGSPTRVKEVM